MSIRCSLLYCKIPIASVNANLYRLRTIIIERPSYISHNTKTNVLLLWRMFLIHLSRLVLWTKLRFIIMAQWVETNYKCGNIWFSLIQNQPGRRLLLRFSQELRTFFSIYEMGNEGAQLQIFIYTDVMFSPGRRKIWNEWSFHHEIDYFPFYLNALHYSILITFSYRE